MRCGTAHVFIQETLDGPLSPPDEAMLEAHLAGCESCRTYRIAIARVGGALGNLEVAAAPRDFAASVQFQIGRERNRRRWTPLAAAAAILVGFVVVRPYLTGDPVQIASQDAVAPVAAKLAPALPGGSMLDAVAARPARPVAALEEAPAAQPQQPEAPAPAERDERAAGAKADSPITIAAAPPPRTITALGAPERAEAESRLAAPADAMRDAAEPAREAAKSVSEELEKKEAGSLSRGGAGAGFAPPAAMSVASAYRTAEARRAKAATRRSPSPAEQRAADMATFEILRWMDPAADGGPNLEFQEVDFTLP